MAVPGWPALACWTASIESVRIVSIDSCSLVFVSLATTATIPPMAGLIASRLRKEIAGAAPFDGVTFKVERRDRLALSGPNGAGKTTLLRMLTGETRLDGGELAFEKGTRVALHDQRPPLERGLSLREYVLDGARDLVAAEE